ncbi:MAG: NAD(P)/FAD-dependent oxidoreductase [Actinobacteria bacterium]|nr:NAD(P)/FAD-dependent oxidoreductase [Actinomycetota bacterium]
MDEHPPRPHPRTCDVLVVGGSAAGLAAALQLGRQRRSVIVVDAGEPRNAPAAHMHSYPGHEGVAPGAFLDIAREEVRSYAVEVLTGTVVDVGRAEDDRFTVELADGHRLTARRVIAATGLVDELPDIEGVAEHWGRDVIHCPFCHGFEVRDQRLVQIVTHPMGLHPAGLFRQLTDRLTLVLHGGVAAEIPELEALRHAGVDVVDARVRRLVTGEDGHVQAIELETGERVEADAVVVGARFRVRAAPFAALGLEPVEHPSGLGEVVGTDPTGETSVPGLYAAGNVTDPSQQVLHAAANGSRVGATVSFSLAAEDIAAAARPSAAESHWDGRYAGGPTWSGEPNGALVDEVGGLAPGRALDVGAGEGGDAIWLAERGWRVTASDVSRQALDHVGALATGRGLEVQPLHADAGDRQPFASGAFDLVTVHYVPIPRSPDDRGVHNLLDAVAPGGTLLFVTHDLAPLRAGSTGHRQRPGIDPDAFVRPDDLVAVLAEAPGWEIEVHEKRPRRGGAGSPHVDDLVLRARRRG